MHTYREDHIHIQRRSLESKNIETKDYLLEALVTYCAFLATEEYFDV